MFAPLGVTHWEHLPSTIRRQPDPPLTIEELAKRRNELSQLRESSDQKLYRETWKQCSLDGDAAPRPAAIQKL